MLDFFRWADSDKAPMWVNIAHDVILASATLTLMIVIVLLTAVFILRFPAITLILLTTIVFVGIASAIKSYRDSK